MAGSPTNVPERDGSGHSQAEYIHERALALCASGDLASALTLLREAVRAYPASADLWNDLGAAHWQSGEPVESAKCFARAAGLEPANELMRVNLGRALLATPDYARGLELLESARCPLSTEIELAMGRCYAKDWALEAASRIFERILTREPGHSEACAELAFTFWKLGNVSAAIENARIAVEHDPGPLLRCHLNRMLHYSAAHSREAIAEEHGAAAQRFFPAPAAARVRGRERAPRRAGYLSGLFEQHRAILNPLMRGHSGMEAICLHDGAPPGPQACVEAVNITTLSDREVIELVRDLGISILVDCDGLCRAGARMGVFAARPAPLQVSLAVYPGGPGLAQIPYRITDRHIDPVPTAGLLQTPLCVDSAFCFEPDADTPPVDHLPAARTGSITFGSFNLLAKFSADTIDCWAAILHRVQDSTLLLHHYLGARRGEVAPEVRERVRRLFAQRGIHPDRVHMVGALDHAEHMRLYGAVDIALDPFPYNGTLTTLNALYMGVPVISLAGTTYAGRAGSSLLGAAGLGRFAAADARHYCELAAEAASDLSALSQLRGELRPMIAASVLMDARGYVASLSSAYRRAWRDSRES